MYALLRENLSRKANFTEEQFEQIEQAVQEEVRVKRKTKILSEGEPCNNIWFVLQGCFRTYTIDAKGLEHVIMFSFQDNWVNDLYSFTTGRPTLMNIEAIEDSVAIRFSKEGFEHLYAAVTPLERVMRLQIQNAYIALQRRHYATLSSSAEERYAELLQSQPGISQHVPLIYIASYLGITPESLSRIRKQLSLK
ncbi:Crp/Fnr family transcriptional regulator [Deminuibacter soli]|uniref:Crp/Fnr family transcriptional regulator n=1 Tax=Deminuibacter soli TaxID=2291815 RepID=A0A3E1NQZ4_9BACT|nr:Crp/Fnr family transcriptional regulator [Deminuibacter soli]RFM30356.1 Crp/Fnr family transcriptional regulator [Deminuibacter soli]